VPHELQGPQLIPQAFNGFLATNPHVIVVVVVVVVVIFFNHNFVNCEDMNFGD